MVVGDTYKLRRRFKLSRFLFNLSLDYHTHRWFKTNRLRLLHFHLVVQILRRQRFVQITLVVARAVSKLFPDLICDFAEVDEVIGNVDKFWRRVRSEARYLDAATF